MGAAAQQRVLSSRARAPALGSCTGRWILHHRTTREILKVFFFNKFYFSVNTFCSFRLFQEGFMEPCIIDAVKSLLILSSGSSQSWRVLTVFPPENRSHFPVCIC